MIKNLSQAAGIIVAAFVLAIMVNHFRPNGLPLTDTWSVKARMTSKSGKSMIIPLEKAKELFMLKKALFIDARSGKDYKKAHIKGALSLPWHEIEKQFMKMADRLPQDNNRMIIAYCDGETCNLSHDLAEFLLSAGFDNVKVLMNGLSAWKNADMPLAGSSVSKKN